MSWGTPDVYYQPEKFGLTPVAEIDYTDGCYQFDLRVVWRHEDGTLYTARDSGCSCPSPFEDYTALDQLDRLDVDAVLAELKRQQDSDYGYVTAAEALQFTSKIRALRDAVAA